MLFVDNDDWLERETLERLYEPRGATAPTS